VGHVGRKHWRSFDDCGPTTFCQETPRNAQFAAARKLACIVWKILKSKQRHVEEDKYLASRKMSRLSQIATRSLGHTTKRKEVPTLIGDSKSETSLPEKYPEEMDRVLGHRSGRGKEVFKRAHTESERSGGEVDKPHPPSPDFHERL